LQWFFIYDLAISLMLQVKTEKMGTIKDGAILSMLDLSKISTEVLFQRNLFVPRGNIY